MAEYIEREAVNALIKAECSPKVAAYLIDAVATIPAADVVARDCYDRLLAENDALRKERPVRHGRWIDRPSKRGYGRSTYCSCCGQHSGIGGIESNRHRAYCPNCGARMDGEKGDNQ